MHGIVRDKLRLIRIAEEQARKTFQVLGNIATIDISSYKPEIDGYVVVVEFEVVRTVGLIR